MDIGVISVRYARALLKSALECGKEDIVYGEMLCLASNYRQVPEVRLAVENPMYSKENKRKILTAACGEKCTDLTGRFISLVLDEDRENIFQFISNSYITLYRKHKNIIRGKLITATSVSEDTERKMREMVESRTNGTVEFETEVDPDIIGGFILEYDTYRMDASVNNRLRNILNTLKK